ncbi:MAG: EamA family transporter [Deltaproteobacteria bacterium]|nr:EamA family transporter [Deltaproteobacteria bacterium]
MARLTERRARRTLVGPMSSAPPRRLVALALAAVYVAWGSTYLAIRVGVGHLPPTVLAGLRFLVAGGAMLAALAAAGRLAPTSRREKRAIALIAFAMLIGGNGLVVWAEQSVPSGLAALVVATVPIWMAGLAALPPARERLPAAAVAGILLGFAGVAVLARPSAGGDFAGTFALLVASFSWSCGSIYARHAGIRADPVTVTAWEMLFAGVMFLAIGTATGGVFAARLDAAGLAAIAYLVVVGSWIGFTAYVWLLANVPAAQAATYAYVNPVIALLLGWWLLDEPITPAILVGSAIVVVAVALVTTARVPARRPAGSVVDPVDAPA